MNKSELKDTQAQQKDAALKSDNQIDLEGRAAARRAYFQGGPGPNDPQNLGYPQELKYPRMEVPVGGDSRQWEQKWFEEAAAVSKQKHGPTGVELELKKKLQRAKLTAKFVREGSEGQALDRGQCYWEFYAKPKTAKADTQKKLLFRASVNDIFGIPGHEISEDIWKWAESKDYARHVFSQIRTEGLDKVAYAVTGVGFTKEGTVHMIRKLALDKAQKIHLLGRRVARNILISEGQLKDALAKDYQDLCQALEDLKMVDAHVARPQLLTASVKDQKALYRVADQSLIDADQAILDTLRNVKTAESTAANSITTKAMDEEMPMDDAPMAEAPMAEEGAAPVSAGVDNPDRARQRDAVMPGGGIPYEEGGQLYNTPDERQAAPFHAIQPASHGDLPYRQIEQLELANLEMGPSGNLRQFDKAEWAIENQQTGGTGQAPVPTGDVYEHFEASGGGTEMDIQELSEPGPGLNMDLPDGRWGFEGAGEDYLVLPEGGLGAGGDAGAEMAPMGDEEAAPVEDEGAEEEVAVDEEPEAADEGEEEEEEEMKVSDVDLSDRRARAERRTQLLKEALEAGGDSQQVADYYAKLNMPGEDYWGSYGRSYGSGPGMVGSREDGFNSTGPAAEKTRADAFSEAQGGGAPAADAGADAEVMASFDAKKTEASQKQVKMRIARAYELAIEQQKKGWIPGTQEALRKQASYLSNLDDDGFENFKNMIANMNERPAGQIEANIQQIAGKQRKGLVTTASEEADYNDLATKLADFGWS